MKPKTVSVPKTTALRRRAERGLRARSAAPGAAPGGPRSDAETRRLLHELQVHQIELEMQNEELRLARDEMESRSEKYSELYDFAPVGYFTLSPAGIILEVNLTAAALTGVNRAQLVGRSFAGLLPAGARADFKSFCARIFDCASMQSGDFVLARPGQPPRYISIGARGRPNGRECRLAVMDVTEHKLAEEKMRVSEIRYRRLFEASHDGVLLIDPATRKITAANPFMMNLLGYGHDQLVGKELFEIGLLKDEAASREMFLKLRHTREVRYEDLPLKSRTGRQQEVEVVANLYEEDGRDVIQCNIRDITERQSAAAALRASEARYRALFDSIDEGYCVIEMIFDQKQKPVDWLFLEVNPSFAKQTGLRAAVGKRVRDLIVGHEESWFEIYGRVAVTGQPVRLVNEARALGRWFDLYAFRLGGPESRTVAVLFSDITERKETEAVLRDTRAQVATYAGQLENLVAVRTAQLTASNRRLKTSVDTVRRGAEKHRVLYLEARLMQQKLRHLARQILTAQEDERREISRELHDEVVQTLVGINVELAALGKAAGLGPRPLKAKIARTQRLVVKAVNVVHRFARELRPAVLDDLGLIPALHAYLKTVAARKNLKLQLTAFAGVEALDSARRTVLYRVVQEAITNVVRHAQASAVDVAITRLDRTIRLEVRDNGKSFEVLRTLSTTTNKRLGLLGMRERVEMVGGTVLIESAPGRGTTVRAEIPFGPAVAA